MGKKVFIAKINFRGSFGPYFHQSLILNQKLNKILVLKLILHYNLNDFKLNYKVV